MEYSGFCPLRVLSCGSHCNSSVGLRQCLDLRRNKEDKFLMKLCCYVVGVLQNNLVLSTEFVL